MGLLYLVLSSLGVKRRMKRSVSSREVSILLPSLRHFIFQTCSLFQLLTVSSHLSNLT